MRSILKNQGSTVHIMIARCETRCLPVIRVQCGSCHTRRTPAWARGLSCFNS